MDNEDSFPCQVCGAEDADWDENAGSLRCPKHHMGGREQDQWLEQNLVEPLGAVASSEREENAS